MPLSSRFYTYASGRREEAFGSRIRRGESGALSDLADPIGGKRPERGSLLVRAVRGLLRAGKRALGSPKAPGGGRGWLPTGGYLCKLEQHKQTRLERKETEREGGWSGGPGGPNGCLSTPGVP
ncbi:hypothetical protein CDL15_Pgr026325 [Punica granatum]|uniref:Uncharacterized protein n=1 Tax=Punica granatum TaxID=22663 RepID=A0A218XY01_PUNGR|nr:hypothetical protein CDL15_Pgr026325 [Punica granatum]PKI51791.1 hypothetical protein CRG98_027839 [Punica granatum]